jgi:hypothetical protein
MYNFNIDVDKDADVDVDIDVHCIDPHTGYLPYADAITKTDKIH